MTPTTTEYFAKIRPHFGSDRTYSWLELSDKTIADAQSYIDRSWNDVTELGESVDDAEIQVIAKKTTEGIWEIVGGHHVH